MLSNLSSLHRSSYLSDAMTIDESADVPGPRFLCFDCRHRGRTFWHRYRFDSSAHFVVLHGSSVRRSGRGNRNDFRECISRNILLEERGLEGSDRLLLGRRPDQHYRRTHFCRLLSSMDRRFCWHHDFGVSTVEATDEPMECSHSAQAPPDCWRDNRNDFWNGWGYRSGRGTFSH